MRAVLSVMLSFVTRCIFSFSSNIQLDIRSDSERGWRG